MRRAVARGTGLTRQLLTFSRRRPVNPESLDLVTHLTGMRAMLDASLGGHIDVRMQFAEPVWPVDVDPGELELAIVNLCVNARDAMSDGGFITIGATNVRLDAAGPDAGRRVSTDPAEFVRLSVADNGAGMPPDVQARAFEPFFTTKDVSKGSGLGLPQVYGFAQQSGGAVTIDSTVGVGTTVTLLLPRSTREPAAAPGQVGAPPTSLARPGSNRQGHVLLVEDDQEVAALTRELLSSLGFLVICVASADAALGALANHRTIDFVLSDVMMPGGVSGLQLAREIRRRHPALQILLTTGYVESVAAMQDGEFTLLIKPYTIESLAEALGIELRTESSQEP
jgi:CheY-like chemotaxis protein